LPPRSTPAVPPSPTEEAGLGNRTSHFPMPPEAQYRHPVGKTLIFLKKVDPRHLHPHDLGENFVPEALPAGSQKRNCYRLSGFLRIFTGRYTGRFFPKEMGSFSKILNLMDIFLRCWHRFHCRIFRPGPARDLSVGESIMGERWSFQGACSVRYRKGRHPGCGRLVRDNLSHPGRRRDHADRGRHPAGRDAANGFFLVPPVNEPCGQHTAIEPHPRHPDGRDEYHDSVHFQEGRTAPQPR
jgi:hypothetical protein